MVRKIVIFLLPLLIFASRAVFAEEVIRKTSIIRGRDYSLSVFYVGDEEVARQKVSPQGIYDQSGEIPDGEVKFVDDYNKTHGKETYKNGKKNGLSKTYYQEGELKAESFYRNGTLVMKREYYNNGSLRLEADYEDAREDKGESGEIGRGKIYFKNGVLKYEWDVTMTREIGFKKCYNKNRERTCEFYYDEEGKVIKDE